MSENSEFIGGRGHHPPGPREGENIWLRKVQHAARQEMVSIPRSVLHRLGIRHGDVMVLYLDGMTICMRPAKIDQILGEGVVR